MSFNIPLPSFNIPVPWPTIPIGGQFVEAFTDCDEVSTRIEPTTHKGKLANARRTGGKLILMWDWEPVFVQGDNNAS